MSATNRGAERVPQDSYRTPDWVLHRLLEAAPNILQGDWLEPCAGEGNLIHALSSYQNVGLGPIPKVDAIEIREECREPLEALGCRSVEIGSFLDLACKVRREYQAVVTNPPFSLAMEVIRASLELDTKYVVMLQRVNFLSSEGRNAFFQANPPDLYILPNRPSFAKTRGKDGKIKKGTDATEYAWFVWQPHQVRTMGFYKVLNHTPADVRKAEYERMDAAGLIPGPEY